MKKIVSLLLCATMLLGAFALCASADDGLIVGYSASLVTKVDLTGMPKTVELIAETPNLNADSYIIEDEADLKAFATYVNSLGNPLGGSMVGKTVYLAKDITLADPENEGEGNFTPILNINGTFDGQGHTISNLKVVTDKATYGVGFFEVLCSGIVKNLILDSTCSFTYTGNTISFNHWNSDRKIGVGAIAGTAYRTDGGSQIQNCSSAATVIGGGNVAGIMGCIDGNSNSVTVTIANCTNSGLIIATNLGGSDGEAGGIVGDVSRNLTISNCSNTGTICGEKASSGILGNKGGGTVKIENCAQSGWLIGGDCGSGAICNSRPGGEPTISNSTEENPDEAYGYDAAAVQKADLSAVADIKTLPAVADSGFDAAYAALTACKITDAEGLRLFSQLTNADKDFFGKTVYLAKDIDMSGVTDFEPIANNTEAAVVGGTTGNSKIFRGTFDGQGYAIKNLVMSSKAEGIVNVGLFGTLRGGVIRNLILDASCSFAYKLEPAKDTGGNPIRVEPGNVRVGALVAFAYNHADDGVNGTDADTGASISYRIENVKSLAKVSTTVGYAGGLVGVAAGTAAHLPYITDISCYGNVGGDAWYAGGVIGAVEDGKLLMDNCLGAGIVLGLNCAAGLFCSTEYNNTPDAITVKNSVAATTVTANVTGRLVYALKDGHITLTACNDAPIVTYGRDLVKYPGYGTDEITYQSTVGYSPELVQKVDLTNVLPICAYDDADIEVKTFKISTPQDLVFFADIVNGGANLNGFTIYLENDLNMAGVTMVPIGSNGDKDFHDSEKNQMPDFAGTFDGQGYVIDNLKMTHTQGTEAQHYNLVGLFGIVASGTVKNVVMGSGCEFTYTGACGNGLTAGIVAYLYRLDIDANKDSFATVENCYSAATVKNSIGAAGGIVGMVLGNKDDAAHVIKNCTNAGSVTSASYAAGIAAYVNNKNLDITACRNIGTVKLEQDTAATNRGVAGICARPNSSKPINIVDCINNGELIGPGTVGGIVAIESSAMTAIQNCSNYGTLTAPEEAPNVGPIYGLNPLPNNKHMINNADRTGLQDATVVTVPGITTNFPDYEALDAAHAVIIQGLRPQQPGGDGGDDSGNEGGDDAGTTTEAPTVTQAPGGNAPGGNAPTATTPAPAPEKKGCGSSVVGATAALVMMLGICGAAFARKKQD